MRRRMSQDTANGRAPLLIAASGLALVALLGADVSAGQRGAQPPAQPQQPRTAKSAAPIDLTGYWVSVVTEDWRWRYRPTSRKAAPT